MTEVKGRDRRQSPEGTSPKELGREERSSFCHEQQVRLTCDRGAGGRWEVEGSPEAGQAEGGTAVPWDVRRRM